MLLRNRHVLQTDTQRPNIALQAFHATSTHRAALKHRPSIARSTDGRTIGRKQFRADIQRLQVAAVETIDTGRYTRTGKDRSHETDVVVIGSGRYLPLSHSMHQQLREL